jgi:glycosyltransferase involved in cell wall biosynthesis
MHCTALSCEELNQQLQDLPQLQEMDLLVHTPGWFPTRWTLITSETTRIPEFLINGESTSCRLLETAADRCLYAVDPFWSQSTHPEHHWLQIRSSGMTLRLQANDAISPWALLQLLRPDVARSRLDPMRSWLFSNGIQECNLLRQHPAVLASLNQRIPGTSLPWFHWALRQQRTDLQQAFSAHDAASMRHWLVHHGAHEHQLSPINSDGLLIAEPIALQPWKQRPFGVNLFGYASEALGIGEDLRTVHTALSSAGIPVQVVDIPRQHSSDALRQEARSTPDQLAPYAFNIVCLTAEEHARVLLELGEAVFAERFTIGYWPWELSQWPKPWQPLLRLADEIWASSQHTHGALQTALGERPSPSLYLLPLPLERLQPVSASDRAHWRSHFQLPQGAPLVICSFDGRSSYARKNPWAAIDAFQAATAPDGPARLVIKTMHAGLAEQQWDQLQARVAADPRLLLIDGVLPRDALLGLYGCCDVLLSLHRAEGYGRVLAEALLLGLDVIATNYSGNCDFCIGPRAHPVGYTLIPLLPDEYPHGSGQVWAEPDPAAAIAQLQQVLRQRAGQSIQPPERSAPYQHLFSPEAIGPRYAERLHQLWANP